MKIILVIAVLSILGAHPHPRHNQLHLHGVLGFNFGKHIHYNHCHVCSTIIDSFFINGENILIVKTDYPLSKFQRKQLRKKIRKHLGFFTNRVKFRFVI